MELAAESEKFEEAARWRDVLRTIEDIRERPSAISTSLEDQDVVGLAREGDRAAAYVFFMRKGKTRNTASRFRDTSAGTPDAELLAGFLDDFYTDHEAPPRLLLPASPARLTGLQSLLGWARVLVLVPRGGKNLKLVEWPAATRRPSCAVNPTNPEAVRFYWVAVPESDLQPGTLSIQEPNPNRCPVAEPTEIE